jgi:hypothetical protein
MERKLAKESGAALPKEERKSVCPAPPPPQQFTQVPLVYEALDY